MALRALASRRLPAVAAAPLRGALAPAGLVTSRRPRVADSRHERNLASKAAVSKMGALAVDPLKMNTTVQGVEYAITGLDRLVNWARKSSLWPMTFGLA